MNKNNVIRFKKFVFLLAMGVIISLASAAYAGFEWTPPAAGPSAQPPAEESSASPEIPMNAEPLSPPPIASSAAPVAISPPASETQKTPVMKTLKISPPQISPAPASEALAAEKAPALIEKSPPQTVQNETDFLPVPDSEPSVQNMPAPKNQISRKEKLEKQTLAVPVPVETTPIAPPTVMAAPPKPEPEATKITINPYPSEKNTDVSTENVSNKGSVTIETTNGFGSDVPMALAIQQIAPPDIAFSFEPGINVGSRVSWEGKDRPWMDVLGEVLSPLGMRAALKDKVVHITKDETPSANAPPVPVIMSGSEDHSAAEQPEKPEIKKLAMTEIKKPSDKPQQNILATEDVRRKLVMDPGEQAQAQNVSALAEIEPTAGTKADPSDLPLWEAQKGQSLQGVLTEWSKKAGVSVSWKAAQDFTLETGVLISGEFKTAVNVLIAQGLAEGAKKPNVEFTANNADIIVTDSVPAKDIPKTTP